MRKIIVFFSVLLFCFAYVGAAQNTKLQYKEPSSKPANALLEELQNAFVDVADRVKPAVVNISAIYIEKYSVPQYEFFFGSPFEDYFDEFYNGQNPRKRGRAPKEKQIQRKYEGTGSGVIIDPQGYILTNDHVVKGASEIRVTLSDHKEYKGKVIGKDERTDLAVIKISSDKKLPFAQLGDSDKIKAGQWVIAIGSPFGLEQTVTSGIISALRQSLMIENKAFKDLIQTDAAINRGNSGGPLCNIEGEVIGINSAIYAPTGVFSGVGFAIPINNAKEILDDLINKGHVVRGWVGVEIRQVDEAVRMHFKLPDTKGVLINEVLNASPAAAAGLKRGDVIIEFSGDKITDPRDLQRAIAATKPKKEVVIKLLRDQKVISLKVKIGEMPQQGVPQASLQPENEDTSGNSGSYEWDGMKIINLTDEMKKKYSFYQNERGCIVEDVQPGSMAHEIGIMAGDLIRSVNRMETSDVAQFKNVIRKVKPEDGILLDINRQGHPIYLSFMGQ